MKQYIQPQTCAQAIEATAIICVSVTEVKGKTPVKLGETMVNTTDAR